MAICIDDRSDSAAERSLADQDPVSGSPVHPFLLGTVVGGLIGAVLGTALSPPDPQRESSSASTAS